MWVMWPGAREFRVAAQGWQRRPTGTPVRFGVAFPALHLPNARAHWGSRLKRWAGQRCASGARCIGLRLRSAGAFGSAQARLFDSVWRKKRAKRRSG
jgi:hypothetical protein